MILPHVAEELVEKLQAIREIIDDPAEVVHLPDQLDKIKEILDEIDEIIELD